VAAREHRVEPLERGDARTRPARHRRLHPLDALARLVGEPRAGLVRAGHGSQARDVGEHLAERGGIERDQLGLRGQPLRDGAHVVERHRADLADRLRHDQVHVELVQRRLVELVQRLAAARALAHRGVDLGRRQPVGDHAARQVG